MSRYLRAGIVSAIALVAASPAAAQSLVESTRLTEPQLAELRGGFDLPGGGSITVGVTTDTRIDGREILRSIFNLNGESPGSRVLARQSSSGDALVPIDLDVDGAGLATRDGVVRLRSQSGGVRVELTGSEIDITHLAGRALGSVIANSANDRSIDVTTTIDIGLTGIAPNAVGGSMARIDTIALDVTSRLNVR